MPCDRAEHAAGLCRLLERFAVVCRRQQVDRGRAVCLTAAALCVLAVFAGVEEYELPSAVGRAQAADYGSRSYSSRRNYGSSRYSGGNPYYGRELYSRRYGPVAGPDLRDDYRYQGLGGYRDLQHQLDSRAAGSGSYLPRYTGHGLYRRLYAGPYGQPAGFGWGAYAAWGLGSYSPKYPYGAGYFYGHPYYSRNSYGRVFGRTWPVYPVWPYSDSSAFGSSYSRPGFRFYGAEHYEPQHSRPYP